MADPAESDVAAAESPAAMLRSCSWSSDAGSDVELTDAEEEWHEAIAVEAFFFEEVAAEALAPVAIAAEAVVSDAAASQAVAHEAFEAVSTAVDGILADTVSAVAAASPPLASAPFAAEAVATVATAAAPTVPFRVESASLGEHCQRDEQEPVVEAELVESAVPRQGCAAGAAVAAVAAARKAAVPVTVTMGNPLFEGDGCGSGRARRRLVFDFTLDNPCFADGPECDGADVVPSAAAEARGSLDGDEEEEATEEADGSEPRICKQLLAPLWALAVDEECAESFAPATPPRLSEEFSAPPALRIAEPVSMQTALLVEPACASAVAGSQDPNATGGDAPPSPGTPAKCCRPQVPPLSPCTPASRALAATTTAALACSRLAPQRLQMPHSPSGPASRPAWRPAATSAPRVDCSTPQSRAGPRQTGAPPAAPPTPPAVRAAPPRSQPTPPARPPFRPASKYSLPPPPSHQPGRSARGAKAAAASLEGLASDDTGACAAGLPRFMRPTQAFLAAATNAVALSKRPVGGNGETGLKAGRQEALPAAVAVAKPRWR